jgi:alpha-tubulin suppressor-like RCC1 family protein
MLSAASFSPISRPTLRRIASAVLALASVLVVPLSHAQVALGGVETVSAGAEHTCLLSTTGGVRCWGSNQHGQLGDGAGASSSYPVDVQGLASGVSSLAVNNNHACAVNAAGAVKCWGQNDWGQLGDNSTQSRATPVNVVGLGSGVVEVAIGISSSCALLASGEVRCWGANFAGQLGDGSTNSRTTPVSVVGLPGPMQQLVSGENFACARNAASQTYCWGSNYQGQLALGGSFNEIPSATFVGALDGSFASLSPGGLHACGVQGGAARCWGNNFRGQIGDQSTTQRALPVGVSGLDSGVARMGLGDSHSCAALLDGTARCWGQNNSGQLGDGSNSLRVIPVTVAGLAGVRSIDGGANHTCAVLNSGGLRCWGANGSGQLGDGTTAGRTTAVVVQERSAPDAPTAVSAVAGDSNASVSFTAPARDGGLAILGYVVTASPGNAQSPLCPNSPCTVTGLQNGISYSFTVVARNALGDSPASVPSAGATPRRSQLLSFGANPGPLPWGSTGVAVSATASSGLAVSFSSLTPSVCAVNGASGALDFLAVGDCVIAADQAGDSSTLPAQRLTQTVQIVRAAQVGFAASASTPLMALGASTTISTQGGTGSGGVSLALAGGSPCALSGSLLSGTGVGTCTVVATRDGDAFYAPASASVQVNVFGRDLVNLSLSSHTLNPAFNSGTALYSSSVPSTTQQLQLLATARDPAAQITVNGLPVAQSSPHPIGLAYGVNMLSIAVTAQDASVQSYLVFVGRRYAQTIQLEVPATAVLGDADLSLAPTGGASGQPVVLSSQSPAVCALNGNQLQLLSAGNCELRGNQAGDANHDAAPELSRTLLVQPGVDLQISADNGVSSLVPQGAVVYRIEVGNAGPSAVTGAMLSTQLPAQLGEVEWICTPLQLATCPAASGSGALALPIDLPVNGVLRFELGGQLDASPNDSIRFGASVQPPAGTVERAPGNNSATDTDAVQPYGVFGNGFEASSTGLRLPQR